MRPASRDYFVEVVAALLSTAPSASLSDYQKASSQLQAYSQNVNDGPANDDSHTARTLDNTNELTRITISED